MIIHTWRYYADQLTPQQVEFLRKCDRNPDHPNGPEGHRLGLIAVAQTYGALGPGGLN